MFHRRLLLLLAVACLTAVVLAAQMANLTVVQGNTLRRRAEGELVDSVLIRTTRGSLLDRHGRVLACDRAACDIAVDYDVLSGRWAYRWARRAASASDTERWLQLPEARRVELANDFQRTFDAQVRDLWRTLAGLAGSDAGAVEARVAAIRADVGELNRDYRRRLLEGMAQRYDEPPRLRDVAHQHVAEQRRAHVVVEDVDDTARFTIERRRAGAAAASAADVWEHVHVRFTARREQPWRDVAVTFDRSTLPSPLRSAVPLEIRVAPVAAHVLGHLRAAVHASELRDHPYAHRLPSGQVVHDLHGYRPGDPIGAAGLERALEATLRGHRGRRRSDRDGNVLSFEPPRRGGDVVTTLDIRLQARVQAIMEPGDRNHPTPGLMRSQTWHKKPADKPRAPRDGDALCGAAVVLDVRDGEVLAAVSAPWRRPAELGDDDVAIARWERENDPWRNRVISRPYPPGSTMKPLVLAAAYTEGKLGLGATLACAPGHLYPNQPDRFRCWIYKNWGHPHEPALDGPEALMRSCNMFFFQVGRRLGPALLRDWCGRFGLGRTTGCGLREEMATGGAAGTDTASAMLMAIGQGPIECTVLQAAAAYATLARGGVAMGPTFVRSPAPPDRQVVDLGLDRRGVDRVLEGLRRSANERSGTSSTLRLAQNVSEPVFDIPDVTIYAKSGTATAPDLRLPDADGTPRVVRQGDHGWLVCLARRPGSDQPDFAIAVVVEYGGSGGHVAGPIANQILHALRHEGYL